MATKTVNLSEEAYARLKNLKQEGESFSDVVNRITGKYAIKDLFGVLTEHEAEAFRDAAGDIDERLREELNEGL